MSVPFQDYPEPGSSQEAFENLHLSLLTLCVAVCLALASLPKVGSIFENAALQIVDGAKPLVQRMRQAEKEKESRRLRGS